MQWGLWPLWPTGRVSEMISCFCSQVVHSNVWGSSEGIVVGEDSRHCGQKKLWKD